MSDGEMAEEDRPARRKRYAGTHPRRFGEKYKERDPANYPETFRRILAAGKTPAGWHVPVMTGEALEALALAPGMRGVDATLGHGGHALRILERIQPAGFLLGLDVDPHELPRAEARIRAAGHGPAAFMALRSNHAGLAKALAAQGIEAVDFVFADLGCSSMQLDDPARGFSYKADGPLDMRMNPRRGLSAADWLQRARPEQLARALRENSDEPRSEPLAAAMAGRVFRGTRELADAVRQTLSGTGDEETERAVRRVFQALRIEVNDEFGALETFLRVVPACLKPGGRLVVLSFHSGEDRRVKQALRQGLRDSVWSEVCNQIITASPAERHANPRSTSAKLRWARR